MIQTLSMPVASEIAAIASLMHKGGLTPRGVTKPEQIAVRILAGREVGLGPVASVNWIMVCNGRATIYGDAALALARVSGVLADIEERWEGEGDSREAVCITKRVMPAGVPSRIHETRFSVADAKKSRLWGKEGPWTDYPDRMLMYRARGWNLRDAFGDVLLGLGITEEEMDSPAGVVVVDAVAVSESTPGPRQSPAAEGIDEATYQALSLARPGWLRAQGIDPNDGDRVKEAWGKALEPYGVSSARALTMAQAKELLTAVATVGHRQESKEVFGEASSES